MNEQIEVYGPKHNIRIVTATSLFDGHDAAINIMRRILQNTSVEVIHLGHNRSVKDIVDAAIEEDAQGIAVSSYQGGHIEFFKYIIDMLKKRGASHIKVFGGGGGVIVADEIKELQDYGVARIYSPEDGAGMGLQGMINHLVESADFSTTEDCDLKIEKLRFNDKPLIARLITYIEEARDKNIEISGLLSDFKKKIGDKKVPVIGITGTGGAGKSSLTDELIIRLLHDIKDIKIAIVSCDPSRRKTGGALLGDRIRMNSIGDERVYMRSLATRKSQTEIPDILKETAELLKAAGYDMIIAETAGIGQGDSLITDIADISLYVMTSEFGAASQLEKIDMLDYADIVVINKFEKKGSEDALRDVRKQVQRNKNAWGVSPDDMPVFGTIASKFNDDGVTALYHAILGIINEKLGTEFKSKFPETESKTSGSKTIIIPPERVRYLSEIADI